MRVAVIPARGGSKRVPRKNVRAFGGKPMMVHSLEVALGSGLFDRVIVSTDDDETAGIARAAGAEVPFKRPPELADDHATTTAVIAHAVTELQRDGTKLSAVCCIYATAPFLRADDLTAGLDLFKSGEWDYVFSATEFGVPIFRAFGVGGDGGVEMFFPEHHSTRSQDLRPAYHDAAQFYWGKTEAWLYGAPIFGARSTVVMIPRARAQDIDTPEDWDQAEAMWRRSAP